MILQQGLKLFTTKIKETIYELQYKLHEYKLGFCFKRKYNLNRNLLSIAISPKSCKLEAESSFISNFDKLIDKCVLRCIMSGTSESVIVAYTHK